MSRSTTHRQIQEALAVTRQHFIVYPQPPTRQHPSIRALHCLGQNDTPWSLSATQRLACTTNPFCPARHASTADSNSPGFGGNCDTRAYSPYALLPPTCSRVIPVVSLTQAVKSTPAYPRSTKTALSFTQRFLAASSSGLAPARSSVLAAHTWPCSRLPRVSVSKKRCLGLNGTVLDKAAPIGPVRLPGQTACVL